MILSYHPIYVGDENLICAGRSPDQADVAAIRGADAVVLPQGCAGDLYLMARENCRYVFPNFDTKFNYPGKLGQIILFREKKVSHPRTEIYASVADMGRSGKAMISTLPFPFPFVFKFDWGGEGETISLIRSEGELSAMLDRALDFERSGRTGFLLQEFIPSGNRSLRVTVIGETFISYWRVQKDPGEIRSNLAVGAHIDAEGNPEQQQIAVSAVKKFCLQTGINLAGFDFLFSSKKDRDTPLFLEINYFFGRKALGGSEKFYGLLITEIQKWIRGLNLNSKNALPGDGVTAGNASIIP